MSVNMYDALSFITVTVKRKFEIPDEETLKYVLNGDGCEIDRDDLLDMLPISEPVVILRSTQVWTKVTQCGLIIV